MTPSTTFTTLDWCVVAAYFLIVLIIGAYFSRGQKNDRGFFLANRSMPMWAVSLSIVATSLSAVTFIGAPQEAFRGDLSYLILNLGGLIAVVIIAQFFIPAFYQSNSLTIYVEKRFNSKVRIAAGICFLGGRLLASGARLFAASLAVSLLFYGNAQGSTSQLITCIVILGATGTIYTFCGGIKAVIWTDVLQIFVVIGSALLSIAVLYQSIPLSFEGMISYLSNSPTHIDGGNKLSVLHTSFDWATPYNIWTGLFAIVFLNIASYGVDQDLVQRMLTCKNAWQGGLSLIISNVIGIAVVILFMIIGLMLFLFNDPEIMGSNVANFQDGALIYPQFLIQHLPSGVSGLAMAGLLAAAMSSLDSAINAMASSVIADVWRPLKKTNTEEFEEGTSTARWTVAGTGLALTLFAIFAALSYDPKSDTLLGFALGVMSYAYAGLLGVFFTGLFTTRGSTLSVYSALFAGAFTVLLLQPYMLPALCGFSLAWPWWMVFGTTVSFITCITGKK
ncbi:MAG: SSS family solute:Na+ symporter [Chlamydiales bacterium]|jgi:SSS family solute:Na+ symporter